MRMDKEQLRTLIVVLVIALGFALGVWWPQHVKRIQLSAEISRARQELRSDAAAHQDMRQWYSQIMNLREQLNHFPTRNPGEGQLASVLRRLSDALHTAGVDDQEVTTGEVNSAEGLTAIPIQIRFRGSFPAAYRVLQQIESMDALLRVDDLQIHRPTDGRESHKLRVQLKLSTFFSADHRGS